MLYGAVVSKGFLQLQQTFSQGSQNDSNVYESPLGFSEHSDNVLRLKFWSVGYWVRPPVWATDRALVAISFQVVF